ncbi:MAG: GntR family transcriptional regulator [Clostridiaceae bacterium]|nr:GntR family transcriptional regulator [Clostridiaceae bacterium]
MAERFGVSRSPIREALRRLCGDGLAELRPNCGISVREFSMDYVRDLLQMRRMQESYGMEQFLASGMKKEDCQELKRFRRLIQKAIQDSDNMSLRAHMDLDAELHLFFNSLNHNQVMDEMWDRMLQVNVMVQGLSLKDKGRALQSQKEHLVVVECLLAGDVAQAVRMNAQHLEHTRIFVEKALAQKRTNHT